MEEDRHTNAIIRLARPGNGSHSGYACQAVKPVSKIPGGVLFTATIHPAPAERFSTYPEKICGICYSRLYTTTRAADCFQNGNIVEINSQQFKGLSIKIDNGTLKS